MHVKGTFGPKFDILTTMLRKCEAKQATGDALPLNYWSRTFANVSRIYFNIALAQSFGYILVV